MSELYTYTYLWKLFQMRTILSYVLCPLLNLVRNNETKIIKGSPGIKTDIIVYIYIYIVFLQCLQKQPSYNDHNFEYSVIETILHTHNVLLTSMFLARDTCITQSN